MAANALGLAFTVKAPNQAWDEVLIHIWPLEGWLYLEVLLDLYPRLAVGWATGQRLTVELAKQALARLGEPNSHDRAQAPF